MSDPELNPSAQEKIAVCRAMYFCREYLGMTARAAVEFLNERRPAEARIDFTDASDWYLWFEIGRRERPGEDAALPVAGTSARPLLHGLVNALVYEANLLTETERLAAALDSGNSCDLDTLRAQLAGTWDALGTIRAIAEGYRLAWDKELGAMLNPGR